jgi:hypothetical protein
MTGDPRDCREHAKRCVALASEVENPVLKESFFEIARRWSKLATDLEAERPLADECRGEDWTHEKKAAS